MTDRWRVQKALLESVDAGDVQVVVQWNDPTSYTATLSNFGDFVRVVENNSITIPVGEGATALAAIDALFNAVSGKTLEIMESRTSHRRNWIFTERGYRPA